MLRTGSMFRACAMFKVACVMAGVLALAAWAGGAHADVGQAGVVVREHTARLQGAVYRYRTEAGYVPIRGTATGELRGRMFYTAYRVPVAAGAPARPVTHFFGGGPSQPGLGFNHRAFGPKSFDADLQLIDNPRSLLPVTDLVFVDAIGTGFSRPERVEYEAEFFNADGDARSLAEFVRVWHAQNASPETPVYLLGGSYGAWRVGMVTQMLSEMGRPVDGAILLSGGILVGTAYLSENEITAYRVPSQAATAFHHGRLSPDVGGSQEAVIQAATAWVKSEYIPALDQVDTLPAARREAIARALSRFTGYPLADIDRTSLRITLSAFTGRLLADQGIKLGWHDMRHRADVGARLSPREDRAIVDDIRHNIGFNSELAYLGFETGYSPSTADAYVPAGERWGWNRGVNTRVGTDDDLRSEPWIPRAMDIHPALRAFVGYGLFDGANNCAANDAVLEHLEDKYSRNYTARCYWNGGHRIYGTDSEWDLLAADIVAFIRPSPVDGDHQGQAPARRPME